MSHHMKIEPAYYAQDLQPRVVTTALQPRTQALFNREKRLIQAMYTDHLRIEQGCLGRTRRDGKCLAENDRFLEIFDRFLDIVRYKLF